MTLLAFAAALWLFVHIGVSGTRLRDVLIARAGAIRFRIAYSIASIAAIALLANAWRAATYVPLWTPPEAFRWLAILLMLPAFILFAGSLTAKNPTALGGEGAEPRGMSRVTRHPMLWSFALWAILHLLNKGSLADLLFFGAFAVTALAGMPSIDAKIAARDPQAWASLKAVTSILPGGAILAGRNHIVITELALPVLIGGLAWAAMLALHATLFGVSPWP